METSKEANGHQRPMEDVTSEQYSALPTSGGGGDRIQLIPNQGGERASGSSAESGTEVSPLQMELGKNNNSCQVEGLQVIIISAVSFSVAITVALIITIYFGPPQVPLQGAVSCDSPVCAEVGTDILKKGGSSVDAAIAATFCLSVVHPFSAGIGGGGYVIMRDNRKDVSLTIDARETAPGAAQGIFDGPNQKIPAGMFVAVPGLLRGLEMAYKESGKLPWASLIEPSIKIANDTGFNVTTKFMASLTDLHESDLQQHVPLHQFLMQKSRRPLEGDTLFNRDLANTLTRIASEGVSSFYEGPLAEDIVRQVENLNGVITDQDFKEYSALKGQPLETRYNNMVVQSVAPPGGGALVLMMLNVMDCLRRKADNGSSGLSMHWFAEAQKFSEVENGHLGDPSFVPGVFNITARMISEAFTKELANASDPSQTFPAQWYSDRTNDAITKLSAYGTCTVTVVGADEHMVAISMSLGNDWGSKVMTENSGVILNNQMESFTKPTDSPQDPNNKVEPGKRPASYLAPSLVFSRTKPCAIRLAVGGGGGDRVPAGVAQVIRGVIGEGQSLKEAISSPRVYVPLLENTVYYEESGNKTLSPSVLQYLDDVGHQTMAIRSVGSIVNAAAKINETVTASADRRNGGGESVF